VGEQRQAPGWFRLEPQWRKDYTQMTIDAVQGAEQEEKYKTDHLKIFCLYHKQDTLDSVQNRPYLQKINLSKLQVGSYQDNRLGENRAFLAQLPIDKHIEYVGYLNARLNKKYAWRGLNYDNLIERLIPKLAPDTVVYAWPADENWAAFTRKMHHGIDHLLKELAKVTELKLITDTKTFWANDFICHRDVWADWLLFWRKTFFHFHDLHGFDLPFPTYNVDEKRKPAYFYERVTSIYFANRTDLKMIPL